MEEKIPDASANGEQPSRGENPLLYALAMAGGVLLGGAALALFHRKTIQGMQRQLDMPPPPPPSDEIY